MSIRNQIQRVRQLGAEARQDWDGMPALLYHFDPVARTVDPNGIPLTILIGGIMQTEVLVEGGFKMKVTAKIRYLRQGADAPPPVRGAIIEVPQGAGESKKYSVEVVRNNLNHPEVVLDVEET